MTRAKVSYKTTATINPVGKMLISMTLVHKRKAELKRLHKDFSWRKIAVEFYNNEIKFGTLERFATDLDYIPKDEKILKALDVLVPPNPYRHLPSWYRRTLEALAFYNTKREQIKSMSDKTHQARKGWKHSG